MSFRLFKKSVMLAMRSKRRFTVFTLMYFTLMVWMTLSLQYLGSSSLLIAIVASIFLSILYAWIIINYRRMEIATLKTIGYTNSDIRVIILGEIIWVTVFAFLLVLEVLIHYTAIVTYANLGLDTISLEYLVITVGIFLLAQIGGIWVAYSRILKLRPIIALRMMK